MVAKTQISVGQNFLKGINNTKDLSTILYLVPDENNTNSLYLMKFLLKLPILKIMTNQPNVIYKRTSFYFY